MGRAKEIEVKVIPSRVAIPFMRQHHYSGKIVNNSNLHLGVFLDGLLHGAMSFGPPLDKRKVMGLVDGTGWHEFLELNRMAFDEYLPRNSESRALSLAMRMLKKNAPQIKWVLSFADGCSCGDGTIYRASNFVLTDIKPNNALVLLPSGEKVHKITLLAHPMVRRPELDGHTFYDITGGHSSLQPYLDATGGKILEGYQFRYIYFIDKKARQRLTVPEIPFSRIDELGAGMYKGARIPRAERHVDNYGDSS